MNEKTKIPTSPLTGGYLTKQDILRISSEKNKQQIYEEELMHHGILGMKWGVRRYQPYPKGHNQLKEGGKFTGKKPNFKKESFVIEKGSQIHRTITSKTDNDQKHKYASFLNKDVYSYAKRSTMFGQIGYDMTIKVTEDIIIPSKKERIQAFVDQILSDESFTKAYANQKIYTFSKPKDIDKITANVKTIEKEYKRFSAELGGASPQVRESYFKNLKQKGYNATLDDADAAFLSRAPILVFDKDKSLQVLKISKIDKQYLKTIKNSK